MINCSSNQRQITASQLSSSPLPV